MAQRGRRVEEPGSAAAQEEPQAGCEAAGHDGGQHARGGSSGPGPAVRRGPRCPGRMVRVFFSLRGGFSFQSGNRH